jgi:hypothetical protein
MRALNRKEDWTIGGEDEVVDDSVASLLVNGKVPAQLESPNRFVGAT